MIKITRAKLRYVTFNINEDGVINVEGKYNLLNEKGDIVAVQQFNCYQGMAIIFDQTLSKDVIENVETAIELQIGIQNAIEDLKKGGEQGESTLSP